ncbi:translationally-controlled tumor protein [Thamnocephalis sphaerospora]|uniref:Translationally-controlled tumor protein homolog n=1 Tax=Thamnocephalis sphaerospora TaxID=78915 RepID=A0A4P9XVZ1_9FUNG|nr:translationally-controlled tumor protein [Thamnocephalis sphaerospora]|eukprot:RKP10464.1 translationally-controlled tumor protein [Thamnocephalis sphaerospora]
MLLYTDIISGDELISDAFKMVEVDDIVYEVDSYMVESKNGEVDIGANPSAEGGDEELEDGVERVDIIENSFRLQQTTFDKKSYTVYIRDYMKRIVAELEKSNPERVEPFKKAAATYVKKVLGNFKDYDFFTGEQVVPEGMAVLRNYREDGITPYYIFFKDGLKEVKL